MTRFLTTFVFSAGAVLLAADATGTWKGTLTPEGEGSPGSAHLVLQQQGDKLTGTAGPSATQQSPIVNGKASGNDLTFEVAYGPAVIKFTARVDGDVLKGDVVREQDGEKKKATLDVTREK